MIADILQLVASAGSLAVGIGTAVGFAAVAAVTIRLALGAGRT